MNTAMGEEGDREGPQREPVIVTKRDQMSILLYQKGDVWGALCLEYGHFGDGYSVGQAIKRMMRDAGITEYVINMDNPSTAMEKMIRAAYDRVTKRTPQEWERYFDGAIDCVDRQGFKALRISESGGPGAEWLVGAE